MLRWLIVPVILVTAIAAWLLLKERDPSFVAANLENKQANGDPVSDEPEFLIPGGDIDSVRQRALSGDNNAAIALANHYMALRRRREQVQWHSLAASRGSCASMSSLREIADDDHNEQASRHWNTMMRRRNCTWGNTYPHVSDNNAASIPLWNEQ